MSEQKSPATNDVAVSISSPAPNGQFTGSANGGYSPSGGSGVVKFWLTDPTGTNPEPSPAAQGPMILSGRLTWTASLDMTGVAPTTTGYLRAIYTVGEQSAEADVCPLTWPG